MMNRNKDALQRGHDIAIKAFNDSAQKCETEDELAGCIQMLCTLSAKMIHGMEGSQFKQEFLRGAICDNEKITPVRASQH